MSEDVVGPCIYCFRLTGYADGVCSHCQRRKQAKETTDLQSKSSKLNYWKERADELALTSGKVQVVVDHGNGSCQVWPKTLVSKDHKVVYETGVAECG